VSRDRVPAPVGDALDCRLEGWIFEGLDLAAVVAHEVMVVVAAGKCGLEARDAVAEVDPMHEAEPVEPFESTVNACDPDAWAGRAKALVHLLSGQATPLPAEELDDRSPRAPAASARLAEAREGALGPGSISHGR